tara:strand:- start:364 stop:1122 length:759 start_codon:yes stop_codon:yes gene_type:complete
MNAIGYMRVSTPKQENSLDLQIEQFTDYCSNNNLKITDIVTEVSSAYYPDQNKLVCLLKSHLNTIIVIKNISRFSRNYQYMIKLLKLVIQNNNILHFMDEKIIYCKDNHNMFFNMISKIVLHRQRESEVKVKNINIKKENNWDFRIDRFGRKVVYDGNIRKVVDNSKENAIINLIKALKKETNSGIINNCLNNILPNNIYPIELIDENGNITNNLTSNKLDYNTIANILNSYNITNRGKKWNINSINKIIKL